MIWWAPEMYYLIHSSGLTEVLKTYQLHKPSWNLLLVSGILLIPGLVFSQGLYQLDIQPEPFPEQNIVQDPASTSLTINAVTSSSSAAINNPYTINYNMLFDSRTFPAGLLTLNLSPVPFTVSLQSPAISLIGQGATSSTIGASRGVCDL